MESKPRRPQSTATRNRAPIGLVRAVLVAGGNAFGLALAVCTVSTCGCATWTDRGESVDPVVRVSEARATKGTNRLHLDVEFIPVRVPSDLNCVTVSDTLDSGSPAQMMASVWQWADETAIRSSARHAMNANGLRVGRVIREEQLRNRLDQYRSDQDDVLDDFLRQASLGGDSEQDDRTIPMRLGMRYDLPLCEMAPESKAYLIRQDDKTVGRTMQHAQLSVAVTPLTGRTANEVVLQLRPEIKHGALRSTITHSPNEQGFRIDKQRHSWPLQQWAIDWIAGEGDLLLLGPSHPQFGIGGEMLRSGDDEQDMTLVLIKVRQLPQP
ncbi:MAG: hypothetical protein AAGA03_12575 [Planctomycetota bacterium]